MLTKYGYKNINPLFYKIKFLFIISSIRWHNGFKFVILIRVCNSNIISMLCPLN